MVASAVAVLAQAEEVVVGLERPHGALSDGLLGAGNVIRRGTAKAHLAYAFAQLGMSSHAELAAEATR